MDVKHFLSEISRQIGLNTAALQLPNCELDHEHVKVMMINEVVPKNPDDWFYSQTSDPENRRTVLGLFEIAGIPIKNMSDVLDIGIYITAALKTPKVGYTADPAVIKSQFPLLEAEIGLFPNLKAIMLMGDVAIKSVNMIVKSKTKKNLIPSQSTYKIRNNEYFWGNIRVFPSYIMTGKNLLIEPFKRDIIVEDIRRMSKVIK